MSDHAAVMFARGRSTRSQMKSPSIAQRGEGGVRGGSGELDPTVQSKPQAQRDAARLQKPQSFSDVSASGLRGGFGRCGALV